MWVCEANLLGQTRRIKPRDTDGKSKSAKCGTARGHSLVGRAARELEIKNSNQMFAVGPVNAEGFSGVLKQWEPH